MKAEKKIIDFILKIPLQVSTAFETNHLSSLLTGHYSRIPGVLKSHLELENPIFQDNKTQKKEKIKKGGKVFLLDSVSGLNYGRLIFEIKDEKIFHLYEPYVQLSADYCAILFENRLLNFNIEILKSNDLNNFDLEKSGNLLYKYNQLIVDQYIANLGGFTWDLGTNNVTWSDGMYHLLKYDKSEKINYSKINDRIRHPDDMERITRWIRESIDSGKEHFAPNEYRLIRKDGNVIHVQTNIQIEYKNKKAIRVSGTCLDITDRKKAEESLEKLNRHFITFLENTSDFIFFKDKDSRIIFCSQALANITGHKNWRDMVGKQDREIFPEDVAKIYLEEEIPIISDKTPLLNQIDPFYNTKGDMGWVITNKWPVIDPVTNEVTGIFGISREITERINIENQLRESEEKFRTFFEKSTSILLQIDPESGSILNANEAASFFYGYPHDKLIRMNIDDINILPADDVASERKRAMEEQRNYFLFEHRLSSGEIRDVEVYSTPLRTGGKLSLFSIIHDVTRRKRAEKTLRESEEKYRTLFESLPIGLVMTDSSGKIIASNETASQILRMDKNRLFLQETDFLQWDPVREDNTPFPSEENPAFISLKTGKPRSNVIMGLRYESETVWVSINSVPLFQENEKTPYAVIISFTDISELKKAGEQLQLAANVFDNAREGIVVTNDKGVIIEVNDTFCKITGYSKDEVIGQNPKILQSGRHDSLFYQTMWKSIAQNGHWSGEIWNKRKNGSIYAELLAISEVRDNQGKVKQYVGLFSDITDLKEHQKQLEHIAHYDALTNLPNRVLLADRLHLAMAQTSRRKQRLAVIYVDLDGFKKINDNFGHDTGDRLLIAISHRMKDALRQGDTIARLGGDEFAIVLVDLANENESLPVLKRILTAASLPVWLEGTLLEISASTGVTFFPQKEDVDADQLLRQADQAMYQAKLAGKNQYHLFDMNQDLFVRGYHEVVYQIRNALIQNQFLLYYQPRVDMQTGKITGFEALVRWMHPKKGIQKPGEFLPVIEENPVSYELDLWILEKAIEQISIWKQDNLEITVSINLSAEQLQSPGFSDMVLYLLNKYPDVTPEQIEFEILESSALRDINQASEVMKKCSEIGIRFSLDDFGTGYSSLAYLKRLSASVLKIDQGFVKTMLYQPEDLAILDGIIGLADAFRMEVIGEGVETLEHGEMLLQLGCRQAQGYFIAHPMPAEMVPRWINTWEAPESWKQAKRLPRSHIPLLSFIVEQRSWFQSLKLWVEGKSASLPLKQEVSSKIEKWLMLEGDIFNKDFLKDILSLVTELNKKLEEILELSLPDKERERLNLLKKASHLQDNIISTLKQIISGTDNHLLKKD